MFDNPTRRACVAGLAAAATGVAFGRLTSGMPANAEAAAQPGRSVTLLAAERPVALPCFAGRTLPLWTFDAVAPLPVLRLAQGERLNARLENALPRAGEPLSVHWHGLRIPLAQDGVPWLPHPPVLPGERHDYSFVPPDTGTFFFHTHCNTTEHLRRGLAGVLIVEGDALRPADAEFVLALRDWRIDEAGQFLPASLDSGAARAGTFGTVRSVNGEALPQFRAPAHGDVRLRVLNIDPTRIVELGVTGGEAALIATDGIACTPREADGWRLGPGMRADLSLRMGEAGSTARLLDHFAPAPVPLAEIHAAPSLLQARAFAPLPLAAPRLPEPQPEGVPVTEFVFGASPGGSGTLLTTSGTMCTSRAGFWSINRTAGAATAGAMPPPLATLPLGRTARFRFVNITPNQHPIHLHGHHMQVLSSSRRDITPYWADTVLLGPRERLEVAFVADNPGDWMLHCHIVEHQETGMMGIVRIA